jgi:hypothetical protein
MPTSKYTEPSALESAAVLAPPDDAPPLPSLPALADASPELPAVVPTVALALAVSVAEPSPSAEPLPLPPPPPQPSVDATPHAVITLEAREGMPATIASSYAGSPADPKQPR